MNAYFIPGLGTDYRIFKNLTALLPFESINYLDFSDELISKAADMKEYAELLAKDIKNDRNTIIIGLSLGGILASELSKLLPECRIILISSIKNVEEAPSVLKFARKIKLYRLVPVWFSRNIVPLLSRIARVTDREGYYLYREMLKGWSAQKLKWARKAALHWNNKEDRASLHIHGTRDHIFPHRNIKNAVLIEKGSHYMVMDRAEEIAELIKKEILG